MAQQEQNEILRANELLEKLIVVQLRGQGVSQNQIAKFLGKRAQTITEMLKTLKPGERNGNDSSHRK